jgi:hypothetical protein
MPFALCLWLYQSTALLFTDASTPSAGAWDVKSLLNTLL